MAPEASSVASQLARATGASVTVMAGLAAGGIATAAGARPMLATAMPTAVRPSAMAPAYATTPRPTLGLAG